MEELGDVTLIFYEFRLANKLFFMNPKMEWKLCLGHNLDKVRESFIDNNSFREKFILHIFGKSNQKWHSEAPLNEVLFNLIERAGADFTIYTTFDSILSIDTGGIISEGQRKCDLF